jgi:O-antigen/teichoic acid export membrane protein
MASVKQLFSQSVIYGLSTVVPRLLNYFLVPLHTRVFVPEQFGIITELYAYVAFFLVLLTFGLETGYFRFSSKLKNDENVYQTTFYFLFVSSLISGFLFYFFSNRIALLLGNNYLPFHITTLGIIVSIDCFTAVPFARLRYKNKALLFSIIKIIGILINVILNILFFWILDPTKVSKFFGGLDLISLVFIANLIQSIFVLALIILVTGIPRYKINSLLLKELLIYSLPLLIAGIGGTTNESFDRIFIRFLIPERLDPQYQLGIYGSNVKLAVLLLLFIQMYRFAAEPFFFQNQKYKESKEMFGKAFKAFIVFCLIIFLAISLNIPILKYFVGEKFRESLLIVPIILLANILYGTYFNFSFWYKLDGKTQYGIKYTFIGAIITILSNVVLIPIIGIFGAAISRVICYFVMNILSFRDGYSRGIICIEKKNLLLYLLITSIIFIIGFGLYFVNSICSVIISNVLLILFIFFVLKLENINLNSIIYGSKNSK